MNKRLPYTAPTADTVWISTADVITLSAADESGLPLYAGFGDFFYLD